MGNYGQVMAERNLNRSPEFPEIPMVDVGLGEYVSEVPSSRFPVYTRGNAGEVWPEVVYPLSISMARSLPDAFGTMAFRTGMVTEEEAAGSRTSFYGVFGGYVYLNLSFTRTVAVRSLGVSIEDSDVTYLNAEAAAPAYVPDERDTDRRATVRGTSYALRLMGRRKIPLLHQHRQEVTRWQNRLPELLVADDQTILAATVDTQAPGMEMLAHHLEVSAVAGAAVQQLIKFCEAQLGDGARALPLLAGLGDVDSAEPSMEMWKLSRIARVSPAVTAQFEAGVNGLVERLAGDAEAQEFMEAFRVFLTDYGSRGPNEWETASETWETDPSMPLALIDRMRAGDDRHDPIARARELAAERRAAIAQVRSEVRGPVRWMFNRLLGAAEMYSRGRERAKTIVVAQIHVSRMLSRELARRAAARSPGGDLKDMWFVLGSELEAYLANPADFADVIAARRATRDELSRRIPPFVFAGEIPAPETWELREATGAEMHSVGTVLEGLTACAGVVEGRACIVTDPSDPGDIGPGDILVAPLTDPAWTPLFVPVEGVVVDVGGQMSHAMIVSRELGLPCVVGVASATTQIPHGARIRVDGNNGTVTLL